MHQVTQRGLGKLLGRELTRYLISRHSTPLGWCRCPCFTQELKLAGPCHPPIRLAPAVLQGCFPMAKGLETPVVIAHKCWGFPPKGKRMVGELEAQVLRKRRGF